MLKPPPTEIPGIDDEPDELFKNALEVVVQYDRASPSLLQRRLSVGYARAARLIDQLEAASVVSSVDGANPRKVLIHSVEDIHIQGRGKKVAEEQDDPFRVPEHYEVPAVSVITKTDKPLWEPQLADVLTNDNFKNTPTLYPLLLGVESAEELLIEDIKDIGNLLVVGNPRSKKEVFIDTLLVTLLLRRTPYDLRLILCDPGRYLNVYDGIPHLLSPVINDYDKSVSALRWSLSEMDRRLKLFAEAGVTGFDVFNAQADRELTLILTVLFLDSASVEITDALTRLTSLGMRVGFSTVIVANRLNDKTVSQDIKANIPARIVFSLSSASEAKEAQAKGTEKLERGELLHTLYAGDFFKLQAIYTPERNVKEVVAAIKQ